MAVDVILCQLQIPVAEFTSFFNVSSADVAICLIHFLLIDFNFNILYLRHLHLQFLKYSTLEKSLLDIFESLLF